MMSQAHPEQRGRLNGVAKAFADLHEMELVGRQALGVLRLSLEIVLPECFNFGTRLCFFYLHRFAAFESAFRRAGCPARIGSTVFLKFPGYACLRLATSTFLFLVHCSLDEDATTERPRRPG
jgi:hypothetical protein